MPWRIVSDGSDEGTYIRYTETGQQLDLTDALNIEWKISAGRSGELVVTYRSVEMEALTDSVETEQDVGSLFFTPDKLAALVPISRKLAGEDDVDQD